MEITGHKNPNWKGGKYISKGYVYLICKNHPLANKIGYVKRSRLVMEKYLNRYLTKKELIHHINGNKQDDVIENLIIMTMKEHINFHRKDLLKGKKNVMGKLNEVRI